MRRGKIHPVYILYIARDPLTVCLGAHCIITHSDLCGVHRLGLPDLPYFTGDAVFQPRSPASRKEVARENESPVFDYRLLEIGRIYEFCDSNLHHAALKTY